MPSRRRQMAPTLAGSVRARRDGSLEEQAGGRPLFSGDERLHAVHPLAGQAERFARGGQHPNVGAALEHRRHDVADDGQHALTVVEDHQCLAAGEPGDEGVDRPPCRPAPVDAERRQHGRRHVGP
jgi:hypothetical protein